MVGIGNKLLGELRHIQVWIVLAGYWEAAVYTWSHIFISLLSYPLYKLHELPKKGRGILSPSMAGDLGIKHHYIFRLNHSSL